MSTRWFALALALAACGTTIHQIPANAPPRPLASRPADSVELFMASTPERPFVEVAFFEAQQSSGFSTDQAEDIIAQLRERAGAVGCDGVIITGPNDKVEGTWSRHGGGGVTTLKGYSGACIVYR